MRHAHKLTKNILYQKWKNSRNPYIYLYFIQAL